MQADRIYDWIERYYAEQPGNTIVLPEGETKQVVLFELPLAGYGDAADSLFQEYKKPDVIGPWYMTPEEWLPEARTVLSLFFPFTEQVRKSNWKEGRLPSQEWLCGRYEGQNFIAAMMKAMHIWLNSQGINACVPAQDARFQAVKGGKGITGYAELNEQTYGSRWSERHAAFVCGLGTFGLSKGLITEKGIAGRFASIILDVPMEPTKRPYSDIYEYCSRCGACARRCPAHAISVADGKQHPPCHAYVDEMLEKYRPRYGCGKCQTAVPCESRIPAKKI